jgi:hypothetical protein
MWKFTQSYIRGCARYQESKAITYPDKLPLQPIMPQSNARPFSMIAMDFIIKLPSSKGYDLILTLTDHNCTKAVILLPCQENMDLLAIAELYLHCVFLFVGLLERVISDWDPKFTFKVFQEICTLLKVKQNISCAYHPQTNRQSEKTNQHMEMVLQIFGNF